MRCMRSFCNICHMLYRDTVQPLLSVYLRPVSRPVINLSSIAIKPTRRKVSLHRWEPSKLASQSWLSMKKITEMLSITLFQALKPVVWSSHQTPMLRMVRQEWPFCKRWCQSWAQCMQDRSWIWLNIPTWSTSCRRDTKLCEESISLGICPYTLIQRCRQDRFLRTRAIG